MTALLQPLGAVYSGFAQLRNWSYEKGFNEVVTVNRPVVSVGNITMGGTGKTPVISQLVQWAQSQNIKVGVVSRGYGGSYTGLEKVKINNQGAQLYGDEPYMLFNKHNIPIYVCADRVRACEELIKNENVDLILADDAFQHRRLFRNLDIVIMDCLEPEKNYAVIPAGRARESFQNLQRAQFVILNKVNLANESDVKSIYDRVTDVQSKGWPQIIRCEYHVQSAVNIQSGESVSLANIGEAILVSGIGRPESFTRSLEGQGVNVLQHIKRKDHAEYSELDVQELMRQTQGQQVLVTEKDAVKLQAYKEQLANFYVVPLETQFAGEVKGIYGKILSLLS